MVARLLALTSELVTRARVLHPIVLGGPLVFGLAALLDALSAADTRRPTLLLLALAAGLTAGAVVGLVCAVGFATLRRGHVLLRWLAWLAVGCLVGAWLCDNLGVWANLSGSYARLARLCLGGAAISGLCVASVGGVLQPTRAHEAGLWGRLPGWLRLAIAALSLLGCAAFAWIDRRGFVIEYPAASQSLRWGGLLLASLLAVEVLGRMERKRATLTRAALGAVSVGALVLFAATGPTQAAPLLGRPYAALALGLLRGATDWDRDGHSAWLGGQDCAAFSSAIGPSAIEVAGNGIDDNCRGGDLAVDPLALAPAPNAAQPSAAEAIDAATPAPMSVVYITVDTVGVQHLGAYGYERATSPHLDRWAKERAVTFDQAYTSGSSTTLVLGSNFRGVYPRRLQWTRVVKTKSGKFLPLAKARNLDGAKVQRTYRLPSADPRPTLPDLLRPRGLKSFAVSAVHFVQADANLVGRFDEQIALTGEGSKEPDDDGATAQALTWLGQLGPEDRFFLWVHYLGPHSPSTRKAGVTDFGRGLVNEYDHEIAVFDSLVAPLLQALSARQDAGEPIAVVLSADHGEEFGQHRYHGHSVEEGTAHIPLFLSLPGVNARRSQALVSSVDVLPTVLALTGTPSPGGLDGRDLSALARGGAADDSRIVLMDGWVNDTNDGLPFNRVAAMGSTRRMRWDLLDFAETARDLPSVRQNLEPQAHAAALAEVKVAHAAAGGAEDPRPLTRDAEDRRLRAALTRYLEQAPVDPRAAD